MCMLSEYMSACMCEAIMQNQKLIGCWWYVYVSRYIYEEVAKINDESWEIKL